MSSLIGDIRRDFSVPKPLQYLFLLYIMLKPFYIFESGSFQPSDAVFVLAFLFFLYYNGRAKLLRCKFDYILSAFVIAVCVINLIYFLQYIKTEFLYSASYYVFNLMIVVVARVLLMDKTFLRKLFWVCRICLYTQVIIFALKLGKFYIDDNGVTDRYLGTFNDPNQLAFYMFALILVMYLIERIDGTRYRLIVLDYAAFVFILYQTASTGILSGFITFGVSYVLIMASSLVFEGDKRKRRRTLRALAVVVCLFVAFMVFNKPIMEFLSKSEMFSRLLGKENLTVSATNSSSSGVSIWQERNIDKLYLYPQYIIYGAGQGYFMRFWRSHTSGEIHSTFLSILFCYGMFPTIMFIYWIWKNVKKTSIYYIPVFLGLLVEGLTLLNQRQPLFWLILILPYSYRIMEERKHEDAFYTR